MTIGPLCVEHDQPPATRFERGRPFAAGEHRPDAAGAASARDERHQD